jgi:predicted RNA binding protein YcfA (HicA-like mRNA interferase family)
VEEEVAVAAHTKYKSPVKRGKVTVAGHPPGDVAPRTFKSILEQAGLKN